MNEITDEHIEHLKHQDFKNKKHEEGCTCGYCELKRWEREQQQLRKEFNKRANSLKLTKEAKEELFIKFQECFGNGFLCVYCNKRMELKYANEYGWTLDHIIPRKDGGKNTVENLCFCCRDCNFQKKIMSVEDFRIKMDIIKKRKQEQEYWKARRASKKDEQTREAYKDIFERRGANK